MNLTHVNTTCRGATTGLAVSLVIGAALALSANAQQIYQPKATPGGIDPRPTITSLSPTGTNTTLNWYGLTGKYHVQASQQTGVWSNVADVTAYAFDGSSTFPTPAGGASLFRLLRNDISYTGAGDGGSFAGVGCGGCHGDVYTQYHKTGHATAYSTIANIPMPTRQSCVVCHTTGFGQPGGFTSVEETPLMANVTCENCHGPAASHFYGDKGGIYNPVVSIAAEVCGGCHDGEHHPTYEEWKETPHSVVTPDVAGGSSGMTNTVNGPGRQLSCGICHSGATRMAMVKDYETRLAGYTNTFYLPTGTDAAAMGVTCVVCHDPHSADTGSAQVRYSLFSTNFYTISGGSVIQTNLYTNWNGTITTNMEYINTYFNTQYNASIQICGQCHNSRNAKWTDTSRPPHHSPQYNLLIGIAQQGYLTTNSAGIATNMVHRRHTVTNAKQCVQCHKHSTTNSFATGHTFEVTYSGCQERVGDSGCHSLLSNEVLSNKVSTAQLTITTNLQSVVALLSQWSLTKAPTLLGKTNYGANAWEYTTKGVLGTATNAGPSAADQAKLPDIIKKARFNLYLVEHDASKGVHNPTFARFLINDAKTNVLNALK